MKAKPLETVEQRSLLRIDFAAALAKLAPAQMQGRWQLPTELARLAMATGARRVELRLGHSRIELRAPGSRLLPGLVRDLARVLDSRLPPGERHHALVALEQRDALALAALAAFLTGEMHLQSGTADGVTLDVSDNAAPRLVAGGGETFDLQANGIDLDVTAAVNWLERKARFSSVPILVQGKEIERGFQAPLITKSLHRPLPASLAIAAQGDVPRLWLLRHGIVSTRATVPGFPAFEAAIEMAAISDPGIGGAALRECVNPHLEELVDAAVLLMVKLSEHLEKVSPKVRERAARLLLEAARRGRLLDEVRSAPAFPLQEQSGLVRMISINELTPLIRYDASGRGHLEAIAPEQSPTELALGDRRVLVLGAAGRTLLGEQLGITFTTPPPRPRSRRSPRSFLAEGIGSLAFTWHGLAGALVEAAHLEDAERAFVAALATAPGEGLPRSAIFRSGRGSVHVSKERLLLPRQNPTVRAAVQAVAGDAAWLYPALLGLLAGRDFPSMELRQRWLDFAE